MTDRDDEARLRAEELHAEFAIRREEQAMANRERRLAHEMEELIKDEKHTEDAIEAELRTEHWGHEPERPLRWKDRRDETSS